VNPGYGYRTCYIHTAIFIQRVLEIILIFWI
jgi:hypothetical protein